MSSISTQQLTCTSFLHMKILQKNSTAKYYLAHIKNKAVYTAAGEQGQYSSWAWAVTHILSPFSSRHLKTRIEYKPTNIPTNGLTYRLINRLTNRVYA